MYVILTSKAGEFHTELGAGLKAVEAYDYIFCGRRKAHFVIAEISGEIKVTIVDETPPVAVNRVPSKFLPKFLTVDAARHELSQLASGAVLDVSLLRVGTQAAAAASTPSPPC